MATKLEGARRGGFAAVTLVALWLAVSVLPWVLPARSAIAVRIQRKTVEARLVQLGFTADQARQSVISLDTERLAALAGTLGTATGGFIVLGFLALMSSTATIGLILWVL